MHKHIILVGSGEMAGVFARGLLKLGHPIIPVTREISMDAVARQYPGPALVLLTVGENDLQDVLFRLPDAWRDCTGLLQNELLPRDWQAHNIRHPTIIAVWFEKKRGQDYKVLVPSPVHGPAAGLLTDALGKLDIPCTQLAGEDTLLFELVRKNVYILTTNIAGLALPAGTDVATLWDRHRALAEQVADEVMDIQFRLAGRDLSRSDLLAGMLAGFEGDRQHVCTGRSAPDRLARALRHADDFSLAVTKLREIAAY